MYSSTAEGDDPAALYATRWVQFVGNSASATAEVGLVQLSMGDLVDAKRSLNLQQIKGRQDAEQFGRR